MLKVLKYFNIYYNSIQFKTIAGIYWLNYFIILFNAFDMHWAKFILHLSSTKIFIIIQLQFEIKDINLIN